MHLREESVNRGKLFMVFKSANHTYVRMAPLFIAVVFAMVCYPYDNLVISCCFLIAEILIIIGDISITPILKVDKTGMTVYRALKKKVFLQWTDIKYVGRWSQRVGQTDNFMAKEMNLMYFSSKPVNTGNVTRQFFTPEITDSFIFATETTKLQIEIEKYLDKSVIDRLYKYERIRANEYVNRTYYKNSFRVFLYTNLAFAMAIIMATVFLITHSIVLIVPFSVVAILLTGNLIKEKQKQVNITRQTITEFNGNKVVEMITRDKNLKIEIVAHKNSRYIYNVKFSNESEIRLEGRLKDIGDIKRYFDCKIN